MTEDSRRDAFGTQSYLPNLYDGTAKLNAMRSFVPWRLCGKITLCILPKTFLVVLCLTRHECLSFSSSKSKTVSPKAQTQAPVRPRGGW
jgi:hypothetical protein